MFSSGPNYTKLKTNLRLCINRLKLLEKKKSEMAMKSRKEIADYIGTGKIERAKIRVEHIIREDYMVEAMEVLEMYCDLLLARFGLIQQMKTLDDGLAEAISSIIWVAPRMQSDVAELKTVADQLSAKYGKPYAQACRENTVETVSAKLMHKLSVQAPPKITVEKYLIEIARYYNVEYDPDPQVMQQEEAPSDNLIDLLPRVPGGETNNLDSNGSNGAGGGGGGFVAPGEKVGMPPAYVPDTINNHPQPFGYPSQPPPNIGGAAYPPNIGGASNVPYPNPGPYVPPPPTVSAPEPPPAFNYNIPPRPESPSSNVEAKDDLNISGGSGPPPYEDDQSQQDKNVKTKPDFLDFPDLPSVPGDTPTGGVTPQGGGGGTAGDDDKEEDIDFDDLSKRFEALKKKK